MVKFFTFFKEIYYMEKELIITIQLIFFVVVALTGVAILIFCLRHKEKSPFDWEAFEKCVKLIHDQTEENLDMLSKMSKEKDKIEEKIRNRKKKLGMSIITKRT